MAAAIANRSGLNFLDGWYDGSLHKIFFSDIIDEKVKKQICSVLAGYVWDKKIHL